VSSIATYKYPVLTPRNALLTGNLAEDSAKKSENLVANSPVPAVEDSSNTVYINDSYNLDTIPFGVENILEMESCQE